MLDEQKDPFRPEFHPTPSNHLMTHTVRELLPDEQWAKLLHNDVLDTRFSHPYAARIVKVLTRTELLCHMLDDPMVQRIVMEAVARNCKLWIERGVHPDASHPS
jgi:hypothetical protein